MGECTIYFEAVVAVVMNRLCRIVIFCIFDGRISKAVAVEIC